MARKAETKPAWVTGFVFWRDQVLLVEKARPHWQAGRLNGVGGRCEPDEEPAQAMARECKEETGLTGLTWTLKVVLHHQKGTVFFYVAAIPASALVAPRNRDRSEPLRFVPVAALPYNVLANLRWIVPLCRDAAVSEFVEVEYDAQIAHARPCPIPDDCLGKRYVVVSESSGPVVGTVESSTDDGVSLCDVRYPDGRGAEEGGRLLLGSAGLRAFMPWPLGERDTLLLAEFMYQDGLREARKE